MSDQVSKKRSYAAPQLNVFGSVRNLTGGSQGMMTDTSNMDYGDGGAVF